MDKRDVTMVFIINSIQSPRCIKRVLEFIKNGYDVDVYAFNRETDKMRRTLPFKYNQLGYIENASSIVKRLPVEFKSVKKVTMKYEHHKNAIFYLFQLDIALAFKLSRCRKPYIYEESDLAHTYIGNSLIKKSLEYIDKNIIQRSLLTVFTSKGFAKYHFGNNTPHNIIFIPNRLSERILDIKSVEKTSPNEFLRIGFVGGPRFESILNFIKVACSCFPKVEMHVFGGPIPHKFEILRKYKNCYMHGPFLNPDDLPNIYSQIDLVLSTYDTKYDNVRYAEPNKLYEAIYFNTPIIVSSGTYLAERVKSLGIGFDLDAMDDNQVRDFIGALTKDMIKNKVDNISKIDKVRCININSCLFEKLDKLLVPLPSSHR